MKISTTKFAHNLVFAYFCARYVYLLSRGIHRNPLTFALRSLLRPAIRFRFTVSLHTFAYFRRVCCK